MKKLLGGLLMAATILTPIVPAAAQERGQRDYREQRDARKSDQRRDQSRQFDQRRQAEQRRDSDQRRQAEVRRQTEQRRDAQQQQQQRRDEMRRNDQRNQQNWRDNDRRDTNRRDWDRRDGRDNRDNRDNRQWNDNRSQNRDWNPRWRDDRRFDYRNYRSTNRQIYRMPRYQSPYRGHSYSRFRIGMGLNNGFYSQRYWINNPSYYRLPPAYGQYRWVRYYDDALLVDVRRGRVVDVLHDFFW